MLLPHCNVAFAEACYCVLQGQTALHIACRHNLPETVALLLRKCASLEFIDERGHTPLEAAVEHGALLCAKLLLAYKAQVRPQLLNVAKQ